MERGSACVRPGTKIDRARELQQAGETSDTELQDDEEESRAAKCDPKKKNHFDEAGRGIESQITRRTSADRAGRGWASLTPFGLAPV